MVCGLILVLALVRILPSEAYGELVLIKAIFLTVIALFGMGLSQAAVRWAATDTQPALILGAIRMGILMAALPATAVLINAMCFVSEELRALITLPFVLASGLLVFAYLANSELLNWYRANQRPQTHAKLSILRAVTQAVAVVGSVLTVQDVSGYVYGLAFGELTLLFALLYFGRFAFLLDSSLLKGMLAYGAPHALVIASSFILNYSDRFMINLLTNSTILVAHYDAASFTAVAFMGLLIRPFNLYIFPAYTKIFEAEGPETTIAFVNLCQRNFIIFGAVFATILVFFRNILMTTLFPEEYWFASEIIFLAASSVIINGVFLTVVAGLYISKAPFMVAGSAIAAVIFNVLANYILIPAYGLIGAAAATALSGVVQLMVGYYFASKVLAVRFPVLLIAMTIAWLFGIDRYIPAF